MNFDNPKKFLNLDGGNEDAEALKNLFENLQFTVEVCPNLNAHYMREKVEEYSEKPHKGAFVLIILSHGGEGDVVYGTDTGEVKVHELQEYFHTTSCRSLAGVPKVFLIDACRGGNHEKVYLHGHRQVRGPSTTSYRSAIGITDSADFMTVYASTRGNIAHMYPNDSGKSGSYFTQTLVEVITEADEDREFNEIITEVRSRIQDKYIQLAKNTEEEAEAEEEEEEENIKEAEGQTVQASSTLLRRYYIKRFVFFDQI